MAPFGGHFKLHFKAIRNLGSLAPPWTALAPFWGHVGVMLGSILGSCWGYSFVLLDAARAQILHQPAFQLVSSACQPLIQLLLITKLELLPGAGHDHATEPWIY